MAAQSTKNDSRGTDVIHFVRQRDYRLIRELGAGACGKTVLLYDDEIDQHFVCKKYAPYSESEREALYASFVREIKLLHQVLHPNVVRVFNYFLYPHIHAGYILMEFVDGVNIEDYVRNHPEDINELFEQAISGFAYLESAGILHRDIRPGNVMVDLEGRLKIIDLGFGKHVKGPIDFDKSITLNWWCQPPNEFNNGKYDFATEVYFVGKLFERIIAENWIVDFNFRNVLGQMCQYEPSVRIESFLDVERVIKSSQLSELSFSDEELEIYRRFSNAIAGQIAKIENGAQYANDPERIQAQLSDAYRSVMLEEFVPDAALLLRIFVTGTYYYKKAGFLTETVRDFVRLLKSLGPEKVRILIANLHTRLDAVPRYDKDFISDDDVPF